jgi:hypothetical protein
LAFLKAGVLMGNWPNLPSVRGKEAILHKIFFDLRYRYGMTYLDRCGRTVNAIMRDHPEWTLLSDHPNPQDAPLISLTNSAAFHFSGRKLDLSLERPIGEDPLSSEDVEQFAGQVDDIADVVIDQLGLKEFSRVGFRAWFIFPCASKDEAEMWLQSLGCFSASADLASTFHGQIEAVNLAVVIAGDDRKFRIAFTGVERQAQLDIGQGILNVRIRDLNKDQREMLLEQQKVKARLRRPEHAAMIDVDAYQEDPAILSPRVFVESSYTSIVENLEQVLMVKK